jgi:hypothetical protein
MSILGPDGQPTGTRKLTDQELIHALGTHRGQLERLSIGAIQSGLFTEWIANQLTGKLAAVEAALADLGVKVDLSIDPSQFPAWAEARYEEIQQQERNAALARNVSLDDK